MLIRLVVAGAAGRMGTRIADLADKDPAFKVVYGLEAAGRGEGLAFPTGQDYGRIAQADAVVDFSSPEASVALAREMVRYRKPLVVGTTGLKPEQEREIEVAARTIAVVRSPNMSLGVNVLFKLAREAARALRQYGIEIVEAHHVHKKDAPSGTALHAARLIEEASGRKVKIESIREGEIVGDHRVIISGPAERLEIFHHAESRDTLAAGALEAAKWVVNRPPGLYTMQDVLGL